MNLGIETEVLEFKKSTTELKEAGVSISAILNKHGVGTIYFGVKNNGDVIGQDVSETTLRDVSHRIAEATEARKKNDRVVFRQTEEDTVTGSDLSK